MSDGAKLSGQQYNRRTDTIIPYTERSEDYSGPETLRVTGKEGDPKTEIQPTDRAAAKVTVYDTTAIEAALAEIHHSWPSLSSIYLPDVLESVSVVWNKSLGSGTATSGPGYMAAINTSVTADASSQVQGSAAISGQVQPVIKEYVSRDLPTMNYSFYIKDDASLAQILTRLATPELANATVLALPVWKPVRHVITAIGGQLSLRQTAEARASGGGSDSSSYVSNTTGTSNSTEAGVQSNTVTIPATIHAAITISNATDTTGTLTVAARAQTPSITSGATYGTQAAQDVNPTDLTGSVAGSTSPGSLSATSPAAIPVTGLYLTDIGVSIEDFGFLLIRASVINFIIFAPPAP